MRTVLEAGQLFVPAGFLADPDGSIGGTSDAIMWPLGTTGLSTAGKVVKIG